MAIENRLRLLEAAAGNRPCPVCSGCEVRVVRRVNATDLIGQPELRDELEAEMACPSCGRPCGVVEVNVVTRGEHDRLRQLGLVGGKV